MTTLCASKAALNHFTRCVAQEEGPNGVRINSLSPGLIVTPILTPFANPALKGELSDIAEE